MVGKVFCVEYVDTDKILSDDLAKLLTSEEFSDIQFEVEGKIFKAHRNILTTRSEYFRTLLCENLKQDRLGKPVHMSNISYAGFKALLHFFYTGEIDPECTCQTACELARVSDWYGLPDLKSKSFAFNAAKLNIENVVDMFVCAVTIEPKLEDEMEICLKFIAKNFQSVLERPEFKKLSKDILVQITQYYTRF